MNNQDPKENYGAEPRRAPDLQPGETLIFSECGRLMPGGHLGRNKEPEMICYRAYYFRVVKPEIGQYRLIVKHGGGQEGFDLTYGPNTITALEKLDSDSRYAMLWQLYETHRDAKRIAEVNKDSFYRDAFLAGRMKSRKRKRFIKFWIEPETNNVTE